MILLLHGWPDDASTWDGIIPTLNDAEFRKIAPTLRGFGAARFLSPGTPRKGNADMLVLDSMEVLDRIGVSRFSIAGHDWGANMAQMLATGWPERVERIAMLSPLPAVAGPPAPKPPACALAMISLVPGDKAWRPDVAP